MDTFPREITERTCRFCLKQTARITPLFDRFAPEEVGEHLQALLGLQVAPDDKHLNVCRKCERQLKLIFSIMVEFRKANELFCALLKKQSFTQELEIVVDGKALIAVTEPESRSDDVEFLLDQQSNLFNGSQYAKGRKRSPT
ncbi:uncharacterized protein LOC131212607 [Anopheles bellator]|uniref:uncharacterized protein LOC131212607 n=1 Tax=Anopheles bellator TaxID=139047 RepID=UPI0026482410|nr:uncharacterized protein LOC131212607 [Anopheles bellator]